MPQWQSDRLQVPPTGTRNLAFIGQYTELPMDVVFTVECFIRSAPVALQSSLGPQQSAPPVYEGTFDPRVLLKSFRALHDVRA